MGHKVPLYAILRACTAPWIGRPISVPDTVPLDSLLVLFAAFDFRRLIKCDNGANNAGQFEGETRLFASPVLSGVRTPIGL